MTKQQKRFARIILFTFIFGVGIIFGWVAATFTASTILMAFFSLIGFVVLAVLAFAAISDDTTEQEELFTYPKPQTWDKSYEHELRP